jgi:hypothetical protein
MEEKARRLGLGANPALTTGPAGLNPPTPKKAKKDVTEAREGSSFCLSLPFDSPGGNLLNPSGSKNADRKLS